MLFGAPERPLQSFGDLAIGCVRLLCCREQAKIVASAVGFHPGRPFLGSPMPRDALVPACVCSRSLRVGHVLSNRRKPEVAYSVVTSVAVDVIEVHGRPFAVNVQPRQSVRPVGTPIDSNHYVPAGLSPSDTETLWLPPFSGFSWQKQARGFFVIKDFPKALWRQWRKFAAVLVESQVLWTIIEPVSVEMKNFVRRPIVMNPQPHQARSRVLATVDPDPPVSLLANRARQRSLRGRPRRLPPFEPAAVNIKGQVVLKLRFAQRMFFHPKVCMRFRCHSKAGCV